MYKPKSDDEEAVDFRMPRQCIWLKLNGSWPWSTWPLLYRLWSWYVILSVGITIYFQSTFLFNNLGNIVMTTENCCTTFMGALNFIRLLHLRLRQQQFKLIIRRFVQNIYIAKNTNLRIERFCQRNMQTFSIMTILLSCLILMYCLLPLLELLLTMSKAEAMQEKPFPYKMIFPYDANSGWRYVLTYIFTAYAGICVVTTLFAEDSIFGFFVTYTCGQFQLLHEQIDELLPAAWAVSLEPEKFQRKLHVRLTELAQRHNKLIRFADQLEQFFSPTLLINFVISSILICMVGFQLVTGKDMFIGDYVKFLVYISSSLSQLYILCYNGDMLTQQVSAASCSQCNSVNTHSAILAPST